MLAQKKIKLNGGPMSCIEINGLKCLFYNAQNNSYQNIIYKKHNYKQSVSAFFSKCVFWAICQQETCLRLGLGISRPSSKMGLDSVLGTAVPLSVGSFPVSREQSPRIVAP